MQSAVSSVDRSALGRTALSVLTPPAAGAALELPRGPVAYRRVKELFTGRRTAVSGKPVRELSGVERVRSFVVGPQRTSQQTRFNKIVDELRDLQSLEKTEREAIKRLLARKAINAARLRTNSFNKKSDARYREILKRVKTDGFMKDKPKENPYRISFENLENKPEAALLDRLVGR
jgi:hypothetical protein